MNEEIRVSWRTVSGRQKLSSVLRASKVAAKQRKERSKKHAHPPCQGDPVRSRLSSQVLDHAWNLNSKHCPMSPMAVSMAVSQPSPIPGD